MHQGRSPHGGVSGPCAVGAKEGQAEALAHSHSPRREGLQGRPPSLAVRDTGSHD